MSEEKKRKINLSGLGINKEKIPEDKDIIQDNKELLQDDKELEILDIPENSQGDNEQPAVKSGKISLAGMRAKRSGNTQSNKKRETGNGETEIEASAPEENTDGKNQEDNNKKSQLKNTGENTKNESEKSKNENNINKKNDGGIKISSLLDNKEEIQLDKENTETNTGGKNSDKNIGTSTDERNSDKKDIGEQGEKKSEGAEKSNDIIEIHGQTLYTDEKESLFTNYTSDFEKEEGTIIEKLKDLSLKPQTRIVLVAVLIGSTVLGVAGLFIFSPEKHSFSYYKEVLSNVYNKNTTDENQIVADTNIKISEEMQGESTSVWEKESIIRTGYKIGVQTQINDIGVKIYKFNNSEFDSLEKLHIEIDIEIKKLQTDKVKDFLLNPTSTGNNTNVDSEEKNTQNTEINLESATEKTNNTSALELLKNRK